MLSLLCGVDATAGLPGSRQVQEAAMTPVGPQAPGMLGVLCLCGAASHNSLVTPHSVMSTLRIVGGIFHETVFLKIHIMAAAYMGVFRVVCLSLPGVVLLISSYKIRKGKYGDIYCANEGEDIQ